jgi:hypothetical protein
MTELKRIELRDCELKLVANVWNSRNRKIYRAEVDLFDVSSETLNSLDSLVPEQYQDEAKIVLTAFKGTRKIKRVSTEDRRFSSVFSSFIADIADIYGTRSRRRR